MELKILHIQIYLYFYYLHLNDMANVILQKQTEQKKNKHLFFILFWNSLKTDNLAASYCLVMFVNYRDRFNVPFILKGILYSRNLCSPLLSSSTLFCR